MNIGEAILAGDARAYGQLADIIRSRGGTHAKTLTVVKEVFAKAGQPIPSDAEIDEKLGEADESQ